MSNVICTDDRFEVIAKYKAKLLDKTNIETSADEMAVIDNILFRMWQIGWLDRLEQPTVDAVPVVRCIQTALPFEYGKVYPICGWNNGVHIIGVSEQGDPVDLVCYNYGDELWDAEKTDGIECLGARFVYCADGERRTDGNET